MLLDFSLVWASEDALFLLWW